MALDEKEIDEIAKKVVEKLTKAMKAQPQKPAPRCEVSWEDDALVLECESLSDRDRAKDILEKGEVRIRVKRRDEEQKGFLRQTTQDSLRPVLLEPKFHLKCGLCSTTPDDLLGSSSDLVRMQEHAMAEHGVTQEEIAQAKREKIPHRKSPILKAYRWRLPDGTIYLLATEA